MLLVLSGLNAIPEYLYEAAAIDRASPWFQFRRITLPQVAPLLLIAVLFRTIEAFKSFDLVMGMTGGGPGDQTELIAVQPLPAGVPGHLQDGLLQRAGLHHSHHHHRGEQHVHQVPQPDQRGGVSHGQIRGARTTCPVAQPTRVDKVQPAAPGPRAGWSRSSALGGGHHHAAPRAHHGHHRLQDPRRRHGPAPPKILFKPTLEGFVLPVHRAGGGQRRPSGGDGEGKPRRGSLALFNRIALRSGPGDHRAQSHTCSACGTP